MLTLRDILKRVLSYFILVISIIQFTACNHPKSEKQDDDITPVSVMPVVKGSIKNTSKFTGIVVPKKVAHVVPNISGKVSSEFFQVGDRVHKGELLFTVDSSEIIDNISILKEQLKVAESNLSLAENKVVAVMGSEYESQKLELESKLKSAEYNYATAKAAFDSATLLLELGKISQSQYNEIKNRHDQAENALKGAINTYDLYETKISEDAQNAASHQLKQVQASYDMIKAQLNSAQNKLEYTNVVSPIDGIIVSKEIIVGCIVSNTMVPYTIMDVNTILIQINVTEQVINTINKGDKLNVTIPSAKNDHFIGVVSTVSPAVNQKTLTYDVLIEVPNKDNIIKPGMTAKVDVMTELRDNCILIPSSAVLSDDYGDYVFAVIEGRAVKKTVDSGITDGEHIEIINGVGINDLIVIRGQHFLRQNDLVMIVGEGTK